MVIELANPREFYINGRWVSPIEGDDLRDIPDAASGRVAATICFGSDADIDAAIGAAHSAFADFSQTSVEDRLAILERICGIYERRMDDLAKAITVEMGAPFENLSRTAQAPAGLLHFRAAIKAARAFHFEERMESGTRIVREPIGVCALVTPWNWPMNQVAVKVAPALAAGCTVVLKPSQFAPLSSHILAEIIDEAGVPPGVFNMVHGQGARLGSLLASHPLVDMVSFTGSNAAAAEISKAAAETVKRVSLELGGKSANIILDGPLFCEAVEHGVREAMSNSGQSCNAPSRMLVPTHRLQEAEAVAIRVAKSLVVGDPWDVTTDMGPLANARQAARVREMIHTGVREGARLIMGGPTPEDAGPDFINPTIFSDVSSAMAVAQTEIFGPVLCMISYSDETEAIAIANDTPYGLSGYVGGDTLDHAEQVARRMRTGMVHLNGTESDFSAPFGGYKQSGNGREWGRWGLEEFLETKAIMGIRA